MDTQALKKENKELRKRVRELNKLVTIDFLTKVYNRRAFSEFFRAIYQEQKWTVQHKTRRARQSRCALIIIDIDDFKKFNDQFGHLYGDKVLRKVAKFLKDSVRDCDIAARWGGEEFAIIMKGVSLAQARKRAKVMLEKARQQLPVTFSIGLAECRADRTLQQTFVKTDKALLKAKKQGKNQIIVG